MTGKHLLFVVNEAAFFLSHRLAIALAAREEGYSVAVVCPDSAAVNTLADYGIRHIPLAIPRGRIDPAGELRALSELHRVFKLEQPHLVHLITSKPIIYGGLVSRYLRIPAIAAVSGLGHVFIDETSKCRILRRLALFGYRAAIRRPGMFPIFQNRDNLALFEAAGALLEEPTLIRGSGADLSRFDPSPAENDIPVVVLPARMLRSKGVTEFVEAARLLKQEGIVAEFALVGDPDVANPAAISREQLVQWSHEGIVRWEPHRSDIHEVLRQSDIVVLPSYNEGLPKTLVDAAAAGRPVVTTDVTGCRDAVQPGETGFLSRPKDPRDLADKLRWLLLDRSLRTRMGEAGRRLAEREFAIERIVAQHLELYRKATDAGVVGR